jgi:hypothetical protein
VFADLDHVALADLVLQQQEKAGEKSLTRLCAPKPTARPTTPAAPRIGATLTPSSPSTSMPATIETTTAIR